MSKLQTEFSKKELESRIVHTAVDLQHVRRKLHQRKENMKALKKEAEQVLKEAGLKKRMDRLKDQIDELKQQEKKQKDVVGDWAVIAYEQHGEKKLVEEVVKIRIYKKFDIPESDAIAWAVENQMPTLLKLNKKNYKNQMKVGTMPSMPGSIEEDPRPFVSGNLDTFLDSYEGLQITTQEE